MLGRSSSLWLPTKAKGVYNLKLESRLLGEISVTSDMQMTPLLWQKMKKS